MDDSQARVILEALVIVPGALRLITSEHDCGGGKHPDIAPFKQKKCDAYKYPTTNPNHFVIHDVTGFEAIPSRPQMRRAVTAEGDYCEGRPSALLTRLQEWQQVAEERQEAEEWQEA